MTTLATIRPTALPAPALTPSRLFSRLRKAAALARQRRDLAALDDAMLRDIGVTRSQALDEAARPFWDAPRHWRG